MFNETRRSWKTRSIVAALLIGVLGLTPSTLRGEEAGEPPASVDGDPGPADPPDLVMDDFRIDVKEAIAETLGITGQGLGTSVVVPAASFTDTNFTNDFRFIYSGYVYSSGSPGTTVCVGGAAALPNGATIVGVTAFAYDNDATHDIGFWLFKKNFRSLAFEIFSADFSSLGAESSVRSFSDVTIAEPVVDNSTNTYYLYACLRSSNHRLYAMQIDFQVAQIFADGFESGGFSAWSGRTAGLGARAGSLVTTRDRGLLDGAISGMDDRVA